MKSTTGEKVKLTLQLIAIFSVVRIFAIYTGVTIIKIPVVDGLLIGLMDFVGSLGLGTIFGDLFRSIQRAMN